MEKITIVIIGIITIMIIVMGTINIFKRKENEQNKQQFINESIKNETYINRELQTIYIKAINTKLTIITYVILIPYIIMTIFITKIYFEFKDLNKPYNYKYGQTTTLSPYK